MFDSEWIGIIVDSARRAGLDPAGLLAVVEIESSGRPYEDDGFTPRFLFERHIFYRELARRVPGRLDTGVRQGLAYASRQKGQYADQGSSSSKLALLARARAVDVACADRACSWGLGQVLGCNAESLGFRDVGAMMAALGQGGVAAQIDLMVRFIVRNGLSNALNTRNWSAFARRYNGADYAASAYDTKLAAAWEKWRRYMDGLGAAPPPVPAVAGTLAVGSRGDHVYRLQMALTARGFALGASDGLFGDRTRAAVEAYQRGQGLAPTGIADATVLAALGLGDAAPAAVGPTPIVEALPDLNWDSQRTLAPPEAISGAALDEVLSPIDRAVGGEALVGKKTAIAVVAYAILSVLQSNGVVGTATGPSSGETAPALSAAVTSPSPSSPAMAPAPPTGQLTIQSTLSPAATTAAPTAVEDTKTTTGQILTILIAAFGALGGLGKFERLGRAASLLAARRA